MLEAQERILMFAVRYVTTLKAEAISNIYKTSSAGLSLVECVYALTEDKPCVAVDPDPTLVANAVILYIEYVLVKPFQFSTDYAEKYGAMLLNASLSLRADNLSSEYLSTLCKIIEQHVHRSKLTRILLTTSGCLLDMLMEWLQIILASQYETAQIGALLSEVASAKESPTLVRRILEITVNEATQTPMKVSQGNDLQMCARLNGLIEMLNSIRILSVMEEMSPGTVRAIISFLYGIIRTCFRKLSVEHEEETSSSPCLESLLVAMNASTLISQIFVCGQNAEIRELCVNTFRNLILKDGDQLDEILDFMCLQILRFQVCQQAMNSIDQDGVAMLADLRESMQRLFTRTSRE